MSYRFLNDGDDHIFFNLMITDVIMFIIIMTFDKYCYYDLEMIITMVAMTIQRNIPTSVMVRMRI